MKPRDNDIPGMNAARELWMEKHDAQAALDLLKRHDRGGRSIEYKLLLGFVKNNKNDYVNSLENVRKIIHQY